MIFLTVGSQLAFDRLTAAVDEWASEHPEVELFGQVGVTEAPPKHFASVETLSPQEYRNRFEAAELIVGHAGMGTIIAALELRKPTLMLPRLARLSESRNDNQVGTARHFARFGLFEVAGSESEIGPKLDQMLADLDAYRRASDDFGVEERLIEAIRDFAERK